MRSCLRTYSIIHSYSFIQFFSNNSEVELRRTGREQTQDKAIMILIKTAHPEEEGKLLTTLDLIVKLPFVSFTEPCTIVVGIDKAR